MLDYISLLQRKKNIFFVFCIYGEKKTGNRQRERVDFQLDKKFSNEEKKTH
jgi:hypothetical protein